MRYHTLIHPHIRQSVRAPRWTMFMPESLIPTDDGVTVTDGHTPVEIGTVAEWADSLSELRVTLDLGSCRRARQLTAGHVLGLSVSVWGPADEWDIRDVDGRTVHVCHRAVVTAIGVVDVGACPGAEVRAL